MNNPRSSAFRLLPFPAPRSLTPDPCFVDWWELERRAMLRRLQRRTRILRLLRALRYPLGLALILAAALFLSWVLP